MNRNDHEFLDTIVNFGIVFRGDIEKIKQLKQSISELTAEGSVKIVFQTLSADRIWIKRGNESRGDMNEKTE